MTLQDTHQQIDLLRKQFNVEAYILLLQGLQDNELLSDPEVHEALKALSRSHQEEIQTFTKGMKNRSTVESRFPIRSLKNPIDAVVVNSNPGFISDTLLRYSLRSLGTYFPFLGSVVVAGVLPPWAEDVMQIPLPHTDNPLEELSAVLEDSRLSATILLCSPNQLLLSPALELSPLYCTECRDLSRGDEALWHKRKAATEKLLGAKGLPSENYDGANVPQLVLREEYLALVRSFRGEADRYNPLSLYYNHIPKIVGRSVVGLRATFRTPVLDPARILEEISGKEYLFISSESMTESLLDFLRWRFPHATRYEADHRLYSGL